MQTHTHAFAAIYTHAHSVVFLTDNLLNTLREVIRESGISPDKLTQDRSTIERGLRTWLQSGHLTKVVVEFHKPGAASASARWDFPIKYTGAGPADDMWLDRSYLRQLISKAARPSTDCTYRVILCTNAGAPKVEGFSDCSLLSTGSLAARPAGTVVATSHMTAAVTYWR